jgi:hypothetical protein
VIFILAIVLLFTLILCSPSNLVYDEKHFYPNLIYFFDVGLMTFVRTYENQAPGPLYQLVHSIPYFYFGNILSLRIFNLFFALSNVFALFLILRKDLNNSILIACTYLTIPLAWVNSGIALTETPTLLFSLVFFCLLKQSIENQKLSLLNILLMAFFLSGSILGRSTFILQIVALCVVGYITRSRIILKLLIFLIPLALCVPFCLFYLWGNLIPPQIAAYISNGGYSFFHLVRAISYSGVVLFILYPETLKILSGRLKLYINFNSDHNISS